MEFMVKGHAVPKGIYKVHRIDGLRFTLVDTKPSKSTAQTSAAEYRAAGWNVRIVQHRPVWLLYGRRGRR